MDVSFYRGKRVLLTGHTGFKGAWLAHILLSLGADVTGYSLAPPTQPNLFSLLQLDARMPSILGDIREYSRLARAFQEVQPQLVFHLAAQPLVLYGYTNPVETYESNVMGTVHLMECVRLNDCVQSVVNVTTDKVYWNQEWTRGYLEDDRLDGYDPYSNSKTCSELVTASYRRSFLTGTAVSTARAGNVIGGGDFSADRIIPDCVRAAAAGQPVAIRNPHSIRPYQHVLDPLYAYLLIAQAQFETASLAGCYNVGPDDQGCITTEELASLFCRAWGGGMHTTVRTQEHSPHESNCLKLDCRNIQRVLGWRPRWSIEQAVGAVVEWEQARLSGADLRAVTDSQITRFFQADKF